MGELVCECSKKGACQAHRVHGRLYPEVYTLVYSSILTYTMLEYTHVYSSILPYIGLREILDFQGIGEFRNILDIQANPI